MKYMLLIFSPAEVPTLDQGAEMSQKWGDYTSALVDAGVLVSGEALQGHEAATTVRVADDGTRTVTDGPFAETREVLGGFYVIDVPDLDAALDWAARCPGAFDGWTMEVRPIVSFAPAAV